MTDFKSNYDGSYVFASMGEGKVKLYDEEQAKAHYERLLKKARKR